MRWRCCAVVLPAIACAQGREPGENAYAPHDPFLFLLAVAVFELALAPSQTQAIRKIPLLACHLIRKTPCQINRNTTAVFEELRERHPGRWQGGQLRTLQRRFRAWRLESGPEREVYFEQRRKPGEKCQSDFTHMGSLGVTVGGVEFRHLCYHFVLPYSNWEWVELARGETFEALAGGLQESLWVLGGVPLEHRTDNLSAATHQLRQTGGREFNERYLEFLGHFGLRASRNHPGRANENGDVESSHGHFKRALDQRLRLRGSRDFRNLEQYRGLLADLVLNSHLIGDGWCRLFGHDGEGVVPHWADKFSAGGVLRGASGEQRLAGGQQAESGAGRQDEGRLWRGGCGQGRSAGAAGRAEGLQPGREWAAGVWRVWLGGLAGGAASGQALQQLVPVGGVRGAQSAQAGMALLQGGGGALAGGVGVVAAQQGAGREVRQPGGDVIGHAGGGGDQGAGGQVVPQQAGREGVDGALDEQHAGGVGRGVGQPEPAALLAGAWGEALEGAAAGVGARAGQFGPDGPALEVAAQEDGVAVLVGPVES